MKKAVFFDFDGTIADSSEGIMECALETVEPLGYDKSQYSKSFSREKPPYIVAITKKTKTNIMPAEAAEIKAP